VVPQMIAPRGRQLPYHGIVRGTSSGYAGYTPAGEDGRWQSFTAVYWHGGVDFFLGIEGGRGWDAGSGGTGTSDLPDEECQLGMGPPLAGAARDMLAGTAPSAPSAQSTAGPAVGGQFPARAWLAWRDGAAGKPSRLGAPRRWPGRRRLAETMQYAVSAAIL
jgi:hypothetical protein